MKYRQLVIFLIFLLLINACASTGDAYFKQQTKDKPHATLIFESKHVGFLFPVTIPVVKPTSINGLLIDQKREYWKVQAFREFLIPPGDTIISVYYSNPDVYGRGTVRFIANRDEVYEVGHTIKEGEIIFEVTDSQHQIVTSSEQFENKISSYMCPDKKLASSLFEASAEGDSKRVQDLLNNGAEPDCIGPRGFTSLIIAASNGHADIVRLLIGAEANINAATGGWTSLIFASDRGYKEIVSVLLDAGADINLSRPGGYTALMAASERGHADIVELLLEQGAYTKTKHLNGKTALDFAKEAGNKDIIDMLEKAKSQ